MALIFKKTAVINMNDKFLSYTSRSNKDAIKVSKNNFENSKVITDIRNRKLYIIIDGHEIYIKHLTLPRLKKEETEKMIYNELKYYINDMSNVIFSYNILNIHENIQEVVAFCLNWSKLNMLKHFTSDNNEIAAVYIIQFCFIKYYKNCIKSNKFMFVFKYNESIYLLICNNGCMISNKVINLEDESVGTHDVAKSVNNLYIESTICDKIDIYFVGVEVPDELRQNSTRYNIFQLDEVSNNEIINYCTR